MMNTKKSHLDYHTDCECLCCICDLALFTTLDYQITMHHTLCLRWWRLTRRTGACEDWWGWQEHGLRWWHLTWRTVLGRFVDGAKYIATLTSQAILHFDRDIIKAVGSHWSGRVEHVVHTLLVAWGHASCWSNRRFCSAPHYNSLDLDHIMSFMDTLWTYDTGLSVNSHQCRSKQHLLTLRRTFAA